MYQLHWAKYGRFKRDCQIYILQLGLNWVYFALWRWYSSTQNFRSYMFNIRMHLILYISLAQWMDTVCFLVSKFGSGAKLARYESPVSFIDVLSKWKHKQRYWSAKGIKTHNGYVFHRTGWTISSLTDKWRKDGKPKLRRVPPPGRGARRQRELNKLPQQQQPLETLIKTHQYYNRCLKVCCPDRIRLAYPRVTLLLILRTSSQEFVEITGRMFFLSPYRIPGFLR